MPEAARRVLAGRAHDRNNSGMDHLPSVGIETGGPHLVYECTVDGDAPWAAGDYIGVTLTAEDSTIVHLSPNRDLVAIYNCLLFPTYAAHALTGGLRLLWAAPVIRRMRQEELSRSLASVPPHLLEPPRLMA